jgi:hypothetical protein
MHMNTEETLRKFLENHQGSTLGFRIGPETYRAKVFAVRVDYVELELVLGALGREERKNVKVPIGAITWVE